MAQQFRSDNFNRNGLLEVAYKELQTTNQELQAALKELEVKNKQLQATNSKLQMMQLANNSFIDQTAHEENLEQLKDNFLSSISHELRSPLCNMKMAIHMLKIAPASTQRDFYLEILHAECERELSLIKDLLDLQQLEAGAYPILTQEINLHKYLPSILEPVRKRTQQLKQTLEVSLPEDLPPVLSDYVSFKRILTELLNNASKHTSNGGAIALSVRYDYPPLVKVEVASCVQSSLPTGTPVATFTIRNSKEIPRAELSRIFGKFHRVPQVNLQQQGGIGLGLALVWKLVEHLKGTIQVESSEGWTTFTVGLAGSSAWNREC